MTPRSPGSSWSPGWCRRSRPSSGSAAPCPGTRRWSTLRCPAGRRSPSRRRVAAVRRTPRRSRSPDRSSRPRPGRSRPRRPPPTSPRARAAPALMATSPSAPPTRGRSRSRGSSPGWVSSWPAEPAQAGTGRTTRIVPRLGRAQRTGLLRTERSAGLGTGTHPPGRALGGRGMITKEAHMGWKIVTGSDNAGYGHKSALKELLENDPRVEEVIDVGVTGREDGTYYPNVAVEPAEKIAAGEADRALLVCGTGLGVPIAANKVPGVRAVTAHDLYSVQRSVLTNNAQV